MVLLSAEQALKAPQIALIVRESERTVQRWLKRYQAEGITGLLDAPKTGKPSKVNQAYRQQLLSSVRPHRRSETSPQFRGSCSNGILLANC